MSEHPLIQGVFVESTDGLIVKKTEHFMNHNMLLNRAKTEQTKNREWNTMHGVCPYCLYEGTWSQFANILPDQKLSKMMKCPFCEAVMNRKTISKYDNMTAYEYCEWFWINWYNWEDFKNKVRPHFPRIKRRVRELRIADVFWDAWKKVKAGNYNAYEDSTKRLDKKVGMDKFV